MKRTDFMNHMQRLEETLNPLALNIGCMQVSDVQTFPWGSFVFFGDPDGNGWAVQQLPARD